MLQWLWHLNFLSASAVFLALNILIFIGALLAGRFIDRFFTRQTVSLDRATVSEWMLSFSTVFINSAITSGGWLLWRAGFILLNVQGKWWDILRDSLVLILTMDLALYVLHRIAHIPFF